MREEGGGHHERRNEEVIMRGRKGEVIMRGRKGRSSCEGGRGRSSCEGVRRRIEKVIMQCTAVHISISIFCHTIFQQLSLLKTLILLFKLLGQHNCSSYCRLNRKF